MKSLLQYTVSVFFSLSLLVACKPSVEKSNPAKIPVIFDTDANNELDDQHALAYLLFNSNTFNVIGVTVNATRSGGNIDKQYAEAERILKLSKATTLPLLKGADGNFDSIRFHVSESNFDGKPAVDFIISQAAKFDKQNKLILIAVGKLTNVALAVEKDPGLAEKVKLVWLGSNYPEPGEYNQDNDTIAMNYLLNKNIPFEMVTVRYGKPSGTGAVSVTKKEINKRMPGLGPVVDPVEGRHGGSFKTFGDYSVNLFDHIDYSDSTQSRALFDMVAVSVVKNPKWGSQKEIPAPVLINNQWIERPENKRKITVWENFNREDILLDFYEIMKSPQLIIQEQGE
jgi:purine nucleosidase